jgi:hypothetical protein
VSVRLRLVGQGNADLLDLPWDQPLAAWPADRLVKMPHGVSRHVVRFVELDGRVYALKETEPAAAQREYHLLRRLAEERLPAVEAAGVVTERRSAAGEPLGAIIITRYLDYAIPFRYVFGTREGPDVEDVLINALVALLVRLHLGGFFWGDCSLSNTLFRRDAGALAAYLVDAETGDLLPSLTDGQRGHDLEIATVNIGGELYDLQAGGRLPASIDPAHTAGMVEACYQDLWRELTAEEVVTGDARHRLDQRVRRINELGFDIDELELVSTDDGHALRLLPQVVEAGHHQRRLERLIGMRVQENQARRLLNDLDAYRGWLEREAGRPVPEAVAAYRWLTELFEPTIAAIPVERRSDLEPAELFHEVLEHRWFLSERAGHEVDTADAVASYVATVRPPP